MTSLGSIAAPARGFRRKPSSRFKKKWRARAPYEPLKPPRPAAVGAIIETIQKNLI